MDLLGGDLGVKVQGHEPLDVGRDTLKLGLVGDHILGLGERRNEVGLGVSARNRWVAKGRDKSRAVATRIQATLLLASGFQAAKEQQLTMT